MNKQLLAALAVVFASSSAIAFEGMYAGFGVGYEFANMVDDDGDKLNLRNAAISLFGGYNYKVAEQMYLGLDTRVGRSFANKILDGVKFKQTWNGSAAVRLGYEFNPETLVFVKAGADYRKFEAKTEVVKFQQSKLGGLLGAGVEYKFNKNIVVRADYTYTDHATDFGTNTGDLDGVIKSRNHQAMLGVAWYF